MLQNEIDKLQLDKFIHLNALTIRAAVILKRL